MCNNDFSNDDFFDDDSCPGNVVKNSKGTVKEDIDYCDCADIPQHPYAKEIHSKYNINDKFADLTVAAKTYFDKNYSNLEYCAFFGNIPVHNCLYFKTLQHNICTYALYCLSVDKEIKLYSFNTTATLAPLQVSPTKKEIFVPNSGAFVIESASVTVVLNIYADSPDEFEWSWYAKTAKEFSIFNKIFQNAAKKYNQYKNRVFDNRGNFIYLPNVTFNDIFLPKNIRKEIQTNIIDYVNVDKLKIKQKNGIPIKRGIIMAGAPGTGKTFLSRVLANTLKITFMVVTNLQGVHDLNSVFEFAEMFERIIILFEDIDIYAGNRNESNIVVSSLLNKLDGIEVNNHLIVMCTTNKLDVLDTALKDRPGRFDHILYFNSPDTALKVEMLKGFCENKNYNDVDFIKVVECIPAEYTGAHLKELYIRAVTEAVENQNIDENGIVILNTDIFLIALEKLRKARKEKSQIGFDSFN